MEQALITFLADEAIRIGVTLDPVELTQFAVFYDEFQIWNAKINLTAVNAGPPFIIRHFIDSLLALPSIPLAATTLLDLGTGGGMPGVPLGIADKKLKVTLLDSSRKKTSFLRHVLIKLGKNDVGVITGRAEDQLADHEQQKLYDVVISRATFNLSRFLTLGNAFVRKEGVIIAMKGREWRKEREEAENVAAACHLRLADVRETNLPHSEEERVLLVYKRMDDFVS